MKYKLREVAQICYGKNQKEVQCAHSEIPILGTGGLMGYSSKPLYSKPSVLIGRKGSISKVRYIEQPFWTVDTLFYTKINEDIVYPRYLYYLLSLIDFSLYDDEVHAAFDDYEAGMAYAKQHNKPVMIDFSGYGCVNCRKMEASVWTDARVKDLLENDFVLITLMVDDKTKLPAPIQIEENGKTRTLRTIGDKWSYLQRSKFGANAQPFYVMLDGDGKPLGPSYAFDEDVSKYVRFLENGLNVFKNK